MQSVEKKFARLFVGTVVTGLALTVAGGAVAQQPPQATPAQKRPPFERSEPAAPGQPTIDAPQRTTATYDDWIVQCELRAGPPVEKLCEMAQVTQVQGSNAPFSRIAIARPIKGQPIKLVVQVPVNVSFATNVRLQTADGDAAIAVPFARCLPAGCFAEFDLKDDTLRKFRAASSVGKVTFADAGGRDVAVPLSFKGFARAFDALGKE